MDDHTKQIPPPNSSERFEDLCHQLFKAVWNDPLAQKVGRRGQAQQGVDIFGSPNQNYGINHGVQCKSKDSQNASYPTISEIREEVAKAEGFKPKLQHWIFATTAPVDAGLQQKAREMSQARERQGTFTVSVLGWGEIAFLLCKHKQVLSAFYPEHGFDVAGLLAELQAMPRAVEVRELLESIRQINPPEHPVANLSRSWHPVVFGTGRDLGPALMGRSLGPEDADACPKFQEVNASIRELKQAYSARIVGEPGAGKSICAYQTALHFAKSGWSVFRLADPRVETIKLDAADDRQRAIYIVDDAHLTGNAVLKIAEETAGPHRLLLSTHNAVKHDTSSRGAIIIDAERAVRTIATALRNERELTLNVVRRIDNTIGDLPSDVSLEDRIRQAVKDAEYPWQFCFIVGGGWRRSKVAVTAARSANADVALAGIATRQLASRNARPSLNELIALLDVAGLETSEVEHSIRWLIDNRLVIGPHDLRCPHQRFASVALNEILEGQDSDGLQRTGQLLKHTVSDGGYPIAGLWNLLRGLRIEGDFRQGRYLIDEASLKPLIDRCWQTSNLEERTFASLVLREIEFYVTGWPQTQFQGREHILGRWISDPAEPTGYGLARLLHAVYNKDRAFAHALVEASEPKKVAASVSSVTPNTAYNLGEILGAIRPDSGTSWGRTFLDGLDRSRLIAFAADWPESKSASGFTNFCRSMSSSDESLALDMFESFIPTAQKLLSRDPVSAFGDLFHIAHQVLRVLDLLGIFVGKAAPKSHHRRLAREIMQGLSSSRLAELLSASELRQFQNTGYLLTFLASAAPAKYRATVAAMDWARIAETIGDHWRDLPHEPEVLFGIAYHAGTCRETIARVIHDNLHRIEAFPPRLVLMAPNAAFTHAERGGLIRLTRYSHVDWRFGVAVLAYFSDERPNLLNAILEPSEITTGRVFSNAHPSWYREAADYVQLIRETAPLSLQRILDNVDVRGAEIGWTESLRSTSGPRRTVALLVESSLDRQDELGALASKLRKRFPKSSVPRDL